MRGSSYHPRCSANPKPLGRRPQVFVSNLFILAFVLLACGLTVYSGRGRPTKPTAPSQPERVTIRGYKGEAMEPFITRDGRYLFFNNLNDPAVNTNLYYAERVDDLTFEFRGESRRQHRS
jgi:hypothetical protein